MQPVAHIIDYYQHMIEQFQHHDNKASFLWDWKRHYRTLNGSWSWTARTKFTSDKQQEIPFDPPYRTLRQEDAYNKLLEAGELDPDNT